MTHVSTSPVTREMLATHYERGRRRPVVVRLEGGTIRLRLKGTRRWYAVAVSSVWLLACRIAVEEAKRTKVAERRERKAARRQSAKP